MDYRRLLRRALAVSSVLLLTVGCGILSQGAEIPSDFVSPIETEMTATSVPSVIPTADPALSEDPVSPIDIPSTATSEAEGFSYVVVSASPVDLQIEIPESWLSIDSGTMWVPAPEDARHVGVSRAELVPPSEVEAILLPENAQILDSEPVETPLGTGRQFRLEVYGVTSPGDDAKADVVSVEVHVLVVVTADSQRIGYDFFATAPTAEALESIVPVLTHMVETAKHEIVIAQSESDYDHITAVTNAKTRLAEHLSISTDAIRVISAEAVDWPDACIGIHKAGQMCAQVITPGYRIIADVDGQRYELHTNTSGSVVGIVP